MTSKPGDVINAAGAILCQDGVMAVAVGQVMVDRAQAAVAKWFGWEIEKELDVDLVVVERKHRVDMPIARTLLRVWPKKIPALLILARPYRGTPRLPIERERTCEKLGMLVGMDYCAMEMSGLDDDDRIRKILVEAGPNTLDPGAGTF